jgi:hypothetical protein
MTECRRLCHGEGFEHTPTFMSIAKAGELLRCPLCGAEAEYSRSAPAHVRATPTPQRARTPIRADE